MQILTYVEKKDITEAISIILDLQYNAEMLTEESTEVELKAAYHNHGIAHGYIRCLRDLKLLQEPSYSKLFMKQLIISEKINQLQEKRTRGTANTLEPHNKIFQVHYSTESGGKQDGKRNHKKN